MYRKIFFTIVLFLGFTSYNAQTASDALKLSELKLGSGAKSLGMGNSLIANNAEFSSVFINPAGLALTKEFKFSGGMNYNSFKNTSSFMNSNSKANKNISGLDQLGFVYPFPTKRGSFSIAFGFNNIADFSRRQEFDGYNSGNSSMVQELAYPDDISYLLFLTDENANTPIAGRLNQAGSIIEKGNLNAWSLAAAVEVAPNVFLGGTFNIFSGNYKRDREYLESDVNNIYSSSILTDPNDPETADFQSFYINDIINWDISGYDFKLGILMKGNDVINFGATLKFPSTFYIKEDYLVDANAEFGTGTTIYLDPTIQNSLEYQITSPYELSGGTSINFANISLNGQLTFIDYAEMEFVDGLDGIEISNINKNIEDAFQSTINYNVGFEYRLPFKNIALRGGFIYMQSPYVDDPSSFDKKYLTAGLGINPSSRFSVNFAYVYGWWKSYTDNYTSGFSRVFDDINSSRVLISFGYNM